MCMLSLPNFLFSVLILWSDFSINTVDLLQHVQCVAKIKYMARFIPYLNLFFFRLG